MITVHDNKDIQRLSKIPNVSIHNQYLQFLLLAELSPTVLSSSADSDNVLSGDSCRPSKQSLPTVYDHLTDRAAFHPLILIGLHSQHLCMSASVIAAA